MLVKSIVSLACIAVAAAQTTKGKAFDHIFIIFLENTDFSKAAANANLASFASQGILLNNYYGVTHPSEPNYIAVTGGDYFGLNDDARHSIPSSYKTIVDLMEDKGLTWKAYQENAPTVCYQDYVSSDGFYFRKHNPFIMYDSIALNQTRCRNVVPATQLQTDLAVGSLPNYSFYTPNMVNDGHNTTVSEASTWLTTFLTPLLANKSFINNTLVVLTFDESESYSIPNRVYTLLLGDVVASVKATTDSTFYTHYSLISTIAANWGLGNLGRQDTNMTVNNVFDIVAKAAGITTNNNISIADAPPMNGTEAGFLASSTQSGSGSAPSPTSTTPTTGSSMGAIIGGVVGGAAIVAIVVGYYVYRRRQSRTIVQKVESQKLEVQQQNGDHSSQKIHMQHPHNPSSLPMSHKIHIQHSPNPSSLPMSQPAVSQPPMSQPPMFQQQFVFSSHPTPNVSTYGYDTQQQQHHQQPVPLVWEPQPFVPSAAASPIGANARDTSS